MAFLNSLNIAGSALTAERFRMDLILHNLSNISTTKTESGDPYRRKQVIFEERDITFQDVLADESKRVNKGGVRVQKIVESKEDFIPVYDPTHPEADENGYVLMPNVDRSEEIVDLMAASRAYEANLSVLNIVKSLTMKSLEIGK